MWWCTAIAAMCALHTLHHTQQLFVGGGWCCVLRCSRASPQQHSAHTLLCLLISTSASVSSSVYAHHQTLRRVHLRRGHYIHRSIYTITGSSPWAAKDTVRAHVICSSAPTVARATSPCPHTCAHTRLAIMSTSRSTPPCKRCVFLCGWVMAGCSGTVHAPQCSMCCLPTVLYTCCGG